MTERTLLRGLTPLPGTLLLASAQPTEVQAFLSVHTFLRYRKVTF